MCERNSDRDRDRNRETGRQRDRDRDRERQRERLARARSLSPCLLFTTHNTRGSCGADILKPIENTASGTVSGNGSPGSRQGADADQQDARQAVYDLGWGGKRDDGVFGSNVDAGGAGGGVGGGDGGGEGRSNSGDEVEDGDERDVTVEGEGRDSVSLGRGYSGIMARVRVEEIAAGALYLFCLSCLLSS